MFKPDERFLEHLKKHCQEYPKKDPQEFTRLYDVFALFGYGCVDPIVYFKDSKEFVRLDDVVDFEDTEYPDITVDNIILFEYESNSFIEEEISNAGLDEFIEDIILEWEEYFNQFLNSFNGRFIIERARTDQLDSIRFHTAWKSWSCYDSYNGEYDGGVDYIGIINMNDLNLIKVECDCGFKHTNGQCFHNCPAPGKIK